MSASPDNPATPAAAQPHLLRSLVQLGRALADPARPLPQRLGLAVAELARLAGAEQASLMLVKDEELVVAAASNQGLVGLSTPLAEETISTRAARSKQPVFVPDLEASPLAALSRQGGQSAYRTASLISLPLLDDGQVVGVLNLSDKAGAASFAQEDLWLMQSVAEQLGGQIRFCALHQNLQEAYAGLSRAQREKDDLMYTIIHDLKAPLTAAREILGLLGQEGGLDPEERERFTSLAQADLDLLWRRVTNLLDLTRMDQDRLPLTPTPLNLGRLAAEAARRLEPACRLRQVSLGMSLDDDPPIMADEDLLERILANLLDNALKFSTPEEGGGGRVEVSLGREGPWLALRVMDSGPGVDPTLGQAVFERFTQGRPTRGSSGLGLYFCARAARLLGGEIAYHNLPQGGACFRLLLPLDAPRA